MDIPINTLRDFFGLTLLALGGFMILTGFKIISVQQVTVKQGRRTWVMGIVFALLGIGLLFPELRTPTPTTSSPVSPSPFLTPTTALPTSGPLTANPTPGLPTTTSVATNNYIIIPHPGQLVNDSCAPGKVVPAGTIFFEDSHVCPGNTYEECQSKLRDYVPVVTVDDSPIAVVPYGSLRGGTLVGVLGLTGIIERVETRGRWALFATNLEPGTYSVRSSWPFHDGSDVLEKTCTLVVSEP